MSSLVQNKFLPLADRLTEESGDRSYPIWLLMNPNYPMDLYTIWNPVMYEIQEQVYRKLHARIDTSNIFIKYAVSSIGIGANAANWWAEKIAHEALVLKENILEFQPRIIITFGSITDEFVRRIMETRPEEGPNYWRSTNLGVEFERAINSFDIRQINRIPLHRKGSKSGRFIEDHDNSNWEDNENYFRDAGAKLAARIIENKESLNIWI